MKRRLESAALWFVPRGWRDAVARDLDEERREDASASWFAVHAAAIGVRLRLAHMLELARRPSLTLPRRSPMHDFARDLAFAVRGAARRPGYSLAVVATLAIGIGANAAIYSVFNWILLRPLPGVATPGELVTIRFQTPSRDGTYFVAYRDYADLRDGVTTTLTGIAFAGERRLDLLGPSDTERVEAELVTVNYFSLLGVRPLMGRDFSAEDEVPGGPASAIISRHLWQRSFASSPAIVGQTIRLNGRPFTVIGVAPGDFQGQSHVTRADVWYTMAGHATMLPPGESVSELLSTRRETIIGEAIGRLRPGSTLEEAQAEATRVADGSPAFASAFFAKNTRSQIRPVLYAGLGHEPHTQASLGLVFRLLMGAVGLLLLLACANAANLLLARSTSRRREIAVCQAIGASRFRIVRQQLAEGLVLAGAAGGVGLAIAVWLTSLFDGMRITATLPAVEGVRIDWRVCTFAFAASLLTGIAFSSAPAIVSSRVDLQTALKNGVGSSRGGRRLLRASLVTLQITVSVLLLVAAGLFIRTLQNIRGIDIGVQTNQVVGFTIQPSRFGLDDQRSTAYLRELLARVRSAPGITNAAFTWTTSFSGNRSNLRFTRADATQQKPRSVAQTTVSPGFFATMGIPLVAGRDFTEAETREKNTTSGSIIVSRTFADRVFPEGNALGSRLVLEYPKGKVVEIVGVVGDVRGRALVMPAEPWAYAPAVEPTWGTIQVRSPLPESEVIATIRRVARSLDPVVAPSDIEGFGTTVHRALAEQRLFAQTSGAFAAVAAVLAGIGIYGMMAGAVSERRKEFGIRLALGARGSSVLALVVRSAATVAGAGLLLGLAAAAAMRRLVEARLYGVTSLDPLTISITAVSIMALALFASLLPAMRAARVDPVRSLRVD